MGCGVSTTLEKSPQALQFRRSRAQTALKRTKGVKTLARAMAKELEELAEQVVTKHNEAGKGLLLVPSFN